MGRNGLGHFRGRNRESTGWFCGHNSLQPSSVLLLTWTERAGRGLTFTSQQSTLRRHGRDRDQNQCRAPGRAAPVSAVLLQTAAPAPQTTAPGWSHRWERSLLSGDSQLLTPHPLTASPLELSLENKLLPCWAMLLDYKCFTGIRMKEMELLQEPSTLPLTRQQRQVRASFSAFFYFPVTV